MSDKGLVEFIQGYMMDLSNDARLSLMYAKEMKVPDETLEHALEALQSVTDMAWRVTDELIERRGYAHD